MSLSMTSHVPCLGHSLGPNVRQFATHPAVARYVIREYTLTKYQVLLPKGPLSIAESHASFIEANLRRSKSVLQASAALLPSPSVIVPRLASIPPAVRPPSPMPLMPPSSFREASLRVPELPAPQIHILVLAAPQARIPEIPTPPTRSIQAKDAPALSSKVTTIATPETPSPDPQFIPRLVKSEPDIEIITLTSPDLEPPRPFDIKNYLDRLVEAESPASPPQQTAEIAPLSISTQRLAKSITWRLIPIDF